MTALPPWAVDGADEGPHPPGPEPLWNESWYLDLVADEDGVGAYVRIGRYPNLGVTWWTTALTLPGRPPLRSVGTALPLADPPAAAVSGEGVDVTCTTLDPLTAVRVSGTCTGHELADVEQVVDAPGAGVPISLDLTWRTDGTPYAYGVTTRYEIPCLVEGTITVDGTPIDVTGHGQRDHSWGVRDWWAFGWCWTAGRLDDGTRVHAADIRVGGHPLAFGYVQHPGGAVVPVTTLDVVDVPGTGRFPAGVTAAIGPDGPEVTITATAYGPLVLDAPDGRRSWFPRALARFEASDGRRGSGWIEWNLPEPGAG